MSTEEQTITETPEEQPTVEKPLTQIITKPPAEKIKNPKRVAQGKKLAEISREAKKRKFEKQQESEAESFIQIPSLSVSVTIIGTATGVVGTYIAWKNFEQDKVKSWLKNKLTSSSELSQETKQKV